MTTPGAKGNDYRFIESHPNVLEVLREFHKRPAESTIEAAIRGVQKV